MGYCPAYFIAPVMDDDFVIRRSIFSYIREDLEDYVFLSTLSKMTNANGVLPIVSVLDAKVEVRIVQIKIMYPVNLTAIILWGVKLHHLRAE